MVPDLAEFVVHGVAAQQGGEWDEIVAAVVEALQQDFTVLHDRTPNAGRGTPRAGGVPVRGTWFDTFDWRLYRAGLLLEYVPGRHGSELRLTPAAPGESGACLTQPVTGWNPSRPRAACELPAGPVADRVATIVAPRALLPIATVGTSAAASRLLNEDAKTVARLIVTRPVLIAGAERRPLPPRLAITEIRGYAGQARRAARLVAEVPGVAAADRTLLDAALTALGRRPADYSNKIEADITAQMPAAQASAVILLRLLDTLEANTDGVLKDIDIEFLHDLRVAVRRTRSALKLLGDTLGGTLDPDEFADEFKWLGDLTTPTRDLDVHLLGFDDMAAGLRAAKPDDLEPFRDYLAGRRAREFRALARGLRSPRFRSLTARWRAALTPIAQERNGKTRGTGRSGEIFTAATLGAERTRRAYAKVARRGGAITPDSPPESLHDLRKRCKELRYALEFFAPLHDRDTYAKVIGDLKRLQDCLGDFQDNEVQIAEIRGLATAMQAAGEAPAVTLLAMGELTAGLAGGQAAARADFERRFAGFAGVDGQRRMSALLRGGAA